MNFDLTWFTTVPGMFITGGVVLLIIALIILIVTGKKAKKEKKAQEAQANQPAVDTPMMNNVNPGMQPQPTAMPGADASVVQPNVAVQPVEVNPMPVGVNPMPVEVNPMPVVEQAPVTPMPEVNPMPVGVNPVPV